MPHDLIPLAAGTNLALISDDLDLAKQLVKEELAQSTRDGYRRDCKQFDRWCASRGVSSLPASGTTMAAYVASLVSEGRIRGSTLSRRLAAIAYAHRIAGEPDPTRDTVRSLLRSARRRLGTAPIHRKAAIVPDMQPVPPSRCLIARAIAFVPCGSCGRG